MRVDNLWPEGPEGVTLNLARRKIPTAADLRSGPHGLTNPQDHKRHIVILSLPVYPRRGDL